MIRVVLLGLFLLLGVYTLVYGLRWLWRTATGQVEEVDGVVVLTGWRAKLPGFILALFVVLGLLLIVERIVNPPDGQVRHYKPATLGEDGRVVPGKTY